MACAVSAKASKPHQDRKLEVYPRKTTDLDVDTVYPGYLGSFNQDAGGKAVQLLPYPRLRVYSSFPWGRTPRHRTEFGKPVIALGRKRRIAPMTESPNLGRLSDSPPYKTL